MIKYGVKSTFSCQNFRFLPIPTISKFRLFFHFNKIVYYLWQKNPKNNESNQLICSKIVTIKSKNTVSS